MTDSMLPIIRAMHEAESDRGRALVLLAVSDAVLMKYRPVFEDACRRARFELGLEFIATRRAAFWAVRGPDGRHKSGLFEEMREAVAEFAGASRAAPRPADAGPPAGRDMGPDGRSPLPPAAVVPGEAGGRDGGPPDFSGAPAQASGEAAPGRERHERDSVRTEK